MTTGGIDSKRDRTDFLPGTMFEELAKPGLFASWWERDLDLLLPF